MSSPVPTDNSYEISWPKDKSEDYTDEPDASWSYIPKRFRRQNNANEDNGEMIVIPGIAELLSKFEEFSKNQNAIMEKQQFEFEKLLNVSGPFIMDNVKNVTSKVELLRDEIKTLEKNIGKSIEARCEKWYCFFLFTHTTKYIIIV